MYYCLDCNKKFEKPLIINESHGLSSPPFEKFSVCPFCKSTDFKEISASYCRCCGARISKTENDFCSDSCKVQYERLKKAEYKRKKQLFESPLYSLLREVEEYNKLHKTSFSYGQYVAIIKPQLSKEKTLEKFKSKK